MDNLNYYKGKNRIKTYYHQVEKAEAARLEPIHKRTFFQKEKKEVLRLKSMKITIKKIYILINSQT